MTHDRWRMRWLFNRRIGWTLFWIVLLLTVTIIVNLFGIRIAGSIDRWQTWMNEHSGFFLAWRLLLYALTAYGWLWMRKRLRYREPDTATDQRLIRMEIAAVIAIMALETSLLLHAR